MDAEIQRAGSTQTESAKRDSQEPQRTPQNKVPRELRDVFTEPFHSIQRVSVATPAGSRKRLSHISWGSRVRRSR